jgi:hypothetical protein
MRAAALVVVSSFFLARPARAQSDRVDAPPTSKGPALGLGVGAGIVGAGGAAYAGDTKTIGEALGASVTESEQTRFTPVFIETLWFQRPHAGSWSLGVVATQRWWSTTTSIRANAFPGADYSIAHSIVALDASLVAGYTAWNGAVRIDLSAGPALDFVHFTERGWLGDSDAVDRTFGFRAGVGPRFLLSQDYAIGLDWTTAWNKLEQHNPLVRDGGTLLTFMADLRFEMTL